MSFTSPASNQHAPLLIEADSWSGAKKVPFWLGSPPETMNLWLEASLDGWECWWFFNRRIKTSYLSIGVRFTKVAAAGSHCVFGAAGLLGFGGGVRIQSTTAVHSRSVGQLLGTNSRGFWPYFGGFETLKIGEIAWFLLQESLETENEWISCWLSVQAHFFLIFQILRWPMGLQWLYELWSILMVNNH